MSTSATTPAMMNASRYSRMTARCFSSGTADGAKQITARAMTSMPRIAARTYGLIERGSDFALFDARRLAAHAVLQVEELGAAHDAAADHVDLVDARRVHEKRAFNADVVRDASNREARRETAVLALDHDAFKGLDALFVAFGHARVDADRIADAEFGAGLFTVVVAEQMGEIHGGPRFSSGREKSAGHTLS